MKGQLSKNEYRVLSVILFAIDFIITGYAGVYLWNNVISVVFDVMTLSFWQYWIISFCISYFIPHKKEKVDDYAMFLLEDIIYTLIVWFVAFLAISFISF